MSSYIVLLRGVNVGGKSKVSMAELKNHIEKLECSRVRTYINSGNTLLESAVDRERLSKQIEEILTVKYKLESAAGRVLILSARELEVILKAKPKQFGEKPDMYHSDLIFLMNGLKVSDAMAVFDPRERVDSIWPGDKVIYSQRLSAERTKSRLNKIMGTAAYKSMTIRTWNTASKLLELSHESKEV